MREFERDILKIIKTGLGISKETISDNFSYENAYLLACEQQLISLLFVGINKCVVNFENSSIYSVFIDSYYGSVLHFEEICYEYEEISQEFENHQIAYAPLKGLVAKQWYPQPDLRNLIDIDILVKVEEYKKVKKVLKKLGYKEVGESAHEYIWKKGEISLEIHKSLIPKYNHDFYSYYGDGWDKLIKQENSSKYLFSNEDNYIYLFTHFAKHYRDRGCGIKYILDFYYCEKVYNLNKEYIDKELKKLHLYEFHKNIQKVIDVWFNETESDELTDFLTKKLFYNAVHGKGQTSEKSALLKEMKMSNGKDNKFIRFFKLVFPSYNALKYKYKVLKKCPILLPVIWVYRWIIAIFNPKKAKEKASILSVTAKDANEYKKELNYVGLDYNFDSERGKK